MQRHDVLKRALHHFLRIDITTADSSTGHVNNIIGLLIDYDKRETPEKSSHQDVLKRYSELNC